MARHNLAASGLSALGGAALGGLGHFGRFCVFAANAMSFIPVELSTPRGWGRLLPQCLAIGAQSVPVLMLTGAFIGMVLIVQGYHQFEANGFADRLGGVVNVSVVSELGPVLAGVMLAGRIGGALAAELGTMNVTEQLLALRSMGADPSRYLVTPRFLACLLLTPLLTCYANLTGALGAWMVFVAVYGGESEPYWAYTRETAELWNIGTGLLKALCFGGVIGMVSCYKGFHCRPGAEGVGRACTESFVVNFIMILILDFFLNMLLNGLYIVWYGFKSLI